MTGTQLIKAGGREALGTLKQIGVWWLHGMAARIAILLIIIPGAFAFGASTALGATAYVGVGVGVVATVSSLWGYGVAKAWRDNDE